MTLAERVLTALWLCSIGALIFWLALGTVAQLFSAKWRNR